MTDTKKISDTASVEALLAGVEERATCKTGMAATRRRFAVVLADAHAAALRIQPRLLLDVGARQGCVDLDYRAAEGGGAYAISDEPSEPELQALAVAHARRNPIAAALDLLRIDLEWHASRAEEVADKVFAGVAEYARTEGGDYDGDAPGLIEAHCGDQELKFLPWAMACAILRPRLAAAQAAYLAELGENA